MKYSKKELDAMTIDEKMIAVRKNLQLENFRKDIAKPKIIGKTTAPANKLTQEVKEFLNSNGWRAWRNNQVPVPGRKFIGEKGLPDIIGFRLSDGKFIGVEIKTLKDRLSAEQSKFLADLIETRGYSIVCSSMEEFTARYKQRNELEKSYAVFEGQNKF